MNDEIERQNRETIRREVARGAMIGEVYYPRTPTQPATPRLPISPPAPVVIPAWPFTEVAVRYVLMGPLGVRNPCALSHQARGELRRLRHRAVLVAVWRAHGPDLIREAERLQIARHWGRCFFAERCAR